MNSRILQWLYWSEICCIFVCFAAKTYRRSVEPISEDGAPRSEELCEHVVGRWSSYIVGRGWDPKPKSRFSKATSNANDSSTGQVTEIVQAQKAKIQAAREVIEAQKLKLEQQEALIKERAAKVDWLMI